MPGFKAIGVSAIGLAGSSAPRTGALAATMAGISLAGAGHAQSSSRVGYMAVTLAGISFAGVATAQVAGRAGAFGVSLAGASLTASGYAQVAGRAGILLTTLDGVSLGGSGQAQPAPRLGTLVVGITGIELNGRGHAQRAGISGALDDTLEGLSMAATGGAFPFRCSTLRTHIIQAQEGPAQKRVLQSFQISPGSRLDFSFDWSAWLNDAGDVIASYSIMAPAAVGKKCIMRDNGVVTVWLEAEQAGYSHQVACDITTAAGRKDSRRITVSVTPQ